jgi:glucosamine--fructose-6-phosphate aminotransferase (isomerizing)
VTEHLIVEYARIPVEVEYALECRYQNSPLDKNTLVFVISQSGETLDTMAKRKGFRTLAITNVAGSAISRESDGGIYQHSGSEIGVASTKAFTAQICVTAMLASYLGRMRDMSFEDRVPFVEALQHLPSVIGKVLEQSAAIQAIAEKYARCDDGLFLGR